MENYTEFAQNISSPLPIVFIDRSLEGSLCDTIMIQNYNAVYRGVESLIQEGHTKIGYISGLPRLSTTIERLSAYRDAMKNYGLPIEDGFVQRGDSMSRSAVPHLAHLLELGCTAVVVGNNVMADDVLYYLNEHDIKIGRGFSIIGYDDTDHTNYNMRRMHMVRQPAKDLGRLAGQQILERMEFPDRPIKTLSCRQALFLAGRVRSPYPFSNLFFRRYLSLCLFSFLPKQKTGERTIRSPVFLSLTSDHSIESMPECQDRPCRSHPAHGTSAAPLPALPAKVPRSAPPRRQSAYP